MTTLDTPGSRPTHYEVEVRGPAYEREGGGVPRIAGQVWRPVTVFREDAIPTPLTFDSLVSALAYASRSDASHVRVVLVNGQGGRGAVG